MRIVRAAAIAGFVALVSAVPASATPVCTDGYKGGPPADLCGGRIFPEARARARVHPVHARPVRLHRVPARHRVPRAEVPALDLRLQAADLYGDRRGQRRARTSMRSIRGRRHRRRPRHPGHQDHRPQGPRRGQGDAALLALGPRQRARRPRGRRPHGRGPRDRRRGAAARSSTASTTTTRPRAATPKFHEYEVADVLAKEAVYLLDFNVDGWAVGDWWNQPAPSTYTRGNTHRHRPEPPDADDRADQPEPQPAPGERDEVRHASSCTRSPRSGRAARWPTAPTSTASTNSQAYMDIMYPAGEFDSVDHRRLMAIAERTKSVIDATLYEGDRRGERERERRQRRPSTPQARSRLKPAHWATVWDTLGYTDTGFIGDYMATELGVTGMDYEIFLNHTVPEKTWNVYLQENHINASRGIIKTAMAYALFQEEEFNADNVKVDPVGRAGYVVNPDTVTDTRRERPGHAAGPGRGRHRRRRPAGRAAPVRASRTRRWFRDENRLMPHAVPRAGARPTSRPTRRRSTSVDTLVLADVAAPADSQGRSYDTAAYYANLKALGRARRQPRADRQGAARARRPRGRARRTRSPTSTSTSRTRTSRTSTIR